MGEDVVWANVAQRVTWTRQRYPKIRLPVAISGSIECHFIRSAVHIEYPWFALTHALGCILHHRTPALVARRHRVDRDLCEITFSYKVLQRLRSFLLVVGVIVYNRTNREQIIFEHAFLGADDR